MWLIVRRWGKYIKTWKIQTLVYSDITTFHLGYHMQQWSFRELSWRFSEYIFLTKFLRVFSTALGERLICRAPPKKPTVWIFSFSFLKSQSYHHHTPDDAGCAYVTAEGELYVQEIMGEFLFSLEIFSEMHSHISLSTNRVGNFQRPFGHSW